MIIELICNLRDDGKNIIFIEHDIGFVRQIAGNVIVMDEGKVIAQGSPEEILSRPDIMEAYVG